MRDVLWQREPELAGGHRATPYCQAPRGWGISMPAEPRSANRRNTSCFRTLGQARGDRSELWYCRLEKKIKRATPPVYHAVPTNDESCLSRVTCPPITELIGLQIDISLSLLNSWHSLNPHQCDTLFHIVSDNKVTSVKTGSTLSKRRHIPVCAHQSKRGQVGRPRVQHLWPLLSEHKARTHSVEQYIL